MYDFLKPNNSVVSQLKEHNLPVFLSRNRKEANTAQMNM